MTEQVVGGHFHEVVGWGAVWHVYRATDTQGSQVAVEVLRPELAYDPEVVQRSLRERSILAGIDHGRPEPARLRRGCDAAVCGRPRDGAVGIARLVDA